MTYSNSPDAPSFSELRGLRKRFGDLSAGWSW
jgi:hypothetical protein